MTTRDIKVTLHRNARDQIKSIIGSELGAEVFKTRVEYGQFAGEPDHHAWTTLYFCPYIYEAGWIVGHSIYRIPQVRPGPMLNYDVKGWDCWNMSDLTSALRLFNYLVKHKEALNGASVDLDPEPKKVPPKIEKPLKRGDQRLELAKEFIQMLRENGTSGRVNDVIMGRMHSFTRGFTIDRVNCYYGPSEWINEANAFLRTFSSDSFPNSGTRITRLKEKAKLLIQYELEGEI